MKKLVFVSAVLLFATCVSAQGILLPPDAVVQPPAEAISANAKVFSGRWEGRWDERMPHVLVHGGQAGIEPPQSSMAIPYGCPCGMA